MTPEINEFIASQNEASPPAGCGPCLEALWYDRKGNWDKAHRIVQDIHTREASWVHAYLHRVEGDMGNAGYWYHRADKPVCHASLEQEWNDLVKNFFKSK